MINKKIRYFQKFSRNNDINGNPYRLILCYNKNLEVIEVHECRSSSPNFEYELYKAGKKALPCFHLSPAEYKDAKRCWKELGMLKFSD